MHQERESTNGGLGAAVASSPFLSPNRRFFSTPQYLTSNGSFIAPLLFPPLESSPLPLSGSTSVSLTPSSLSCDDEDPTSTDHRLYLARLTLQYQEMVERYEICLSQLHDASQELQILRRENSSLRTANSKLARRLTLLSGEKNARVATSAGGSLDMSIVSDFGRLHVGEGDTASGTSPTSVLQCQGSSFPRRPPEQRISLPKSISIRSTGFLKEKGAKGSPSEEGLLRVSTPVIIGTRKVYVPSGSQEDEPLEFEVYNQGMQKTELCNKWQETGTCPYGDHCQFAHGIGELRPVIRHPRYKTEVCRMVLSGDNCPYGHRCHFRHALTPRDNLMGPT